MVRWLSSLLQQAGIVKNETGNGLNTAPRIGSLFEYLGRIGIYPYDPNSDYQAGQWCIYDGVLTEVVADAAVGQTPVTHAAKYSRKIVIDKSQIVSNNTLPVAAGAVADMIADVTTLITGGGTPTADTTRRGTVRQSTEAEFSAGTNNDAFTTPKQVKGLFQGIVEGIQKITGVSLDIALQGGVLSAIMPIFDGGIQATLPAVPQGVQTGNVVIGPDGTMYSTTGSVVTPTPTVYSFTGGVHYEAVPAVSEQSTQPFLANPTDDWPITSRGMSQKILAEDEFTFNPTATYTLQVLRLSSDGTSDTVSPLPAWLTFYPDLRKIVATVTADIENTAFPVRVTKSDATGRAANDDFLLILDVPPLPACSNYFQLSAAQYSALPIVTVQEYYDGTVGMSTGIAYTVRAFVSRAEAIANIGYSGKKVSFDYNRATSSACAIGDTLYNDNRPEHILDKTNPYWPVEAGFWGINLVMPSGGNPGSYVLIQTNACGIVTSRETITILTS